MVVAVVVVVVFVVVVVVVVVAVVVVFVVVRCSPAARQCQASGSMLIHKSPMSSVAVFV